MKNFEPIEFEGYKGLHSKSQNVMVLEIPASKEGDHYDVTIFGEESLVQCECKGYVYRESCKHVTLVRNLLGM